MKRSTFKLTLTAFLLLCMLFVIAACGDSSTDADADGANNSENHSDSADEAQNNDAAAENNDSTEEADSPADAVELTLGHMNPTEHVQHSMVMQPWTEEVEEKTEGRVSFEIHPGGALAAPNETLDAILTGVMDTGWSLHGYNPGAFEVHSVMHLPSLADATAAELSIIAQELYETFPEIQEEYSGAELMWVHAADPYAIVTNTPVESFEDVQGLRLRTPHDEGGKMIESWGATAVSMPATEIYESMERGVIDGGVLPVAAIKDFNIFDVVDYVTLGNFNSAIYYVMMNENSWEQIPAEDQEIIQETIGTPMAEQAGAAFDYQAEQAYEEGLEQGIEFIELDEAELQKFRDAAEVVTEDWVEKMEAQGVDGQAILDKIDELVEEIVE